MKNSKLNIVYNKNLLEIKLKNTIIKADELISALRKQLKIQNNKKIILVKQEDQVYNEGDTEIIPLTKDKIYLIEKDKYEETKQQKKNMAELIMKVTGGTEPLKAPEIEVTNKKRAIPFCYGHLPSDLVDDDESYFSDEDEIYFSEYDFDDHNSLSRSQEMTNEIIQEIANRNHSSLNPQVNNQNNFRRVVSEYNFHEIANRNNPLVNAQVNNQNNFQRPVHLGLINVDNDMLNIFLDMGFQENNIIIALRLANNNFEYACNILTNAPPEVFLDNNHLSAPNQNINSQNHQVPVSSNSFQIGRNPFLMNTNNQNANQIPNESNNPRNNYNSGNLPFRVVRVELNRDSNYYNDQFLSQSESSNESMIEIEEGVFIPQSIIRASKLFLNYSNRT
jgi:hypothetical protein